MTLLPQASLGPYAWGRGADPKFLCAKGISDAPLQGHAVRKKANMSWVDNGDIKYIPRASEVFSLIEKDTSLSYSLPAVGSTAGKVLQHAHSVYERIHRENFPMIFKFGIAHCAHFRMHNAIYGYRGGRDKFEHLMVLFASTERVGPAFLESALIHSYIGSLTCFNIYFYVLLFLEKDYNIIQYISDTCRAEVLLDVEMCGSGVTQSPKTMRMRVHFSPM